MNLIPALGLFGTLGTPELVIILVILLLLFGGSKLPQLAKSMGKSIREFKSEMKEAQAEDAARKSNGNGAAEKKVAENPASSFCSKCGAQTTDPEARFCPKCGQSL
jgi:sec-independent protein translocase protein TatA